MARTPSKIDNGKKIVLADPADAQPAAPPAIDLVFKKLGGTDSIAFNRMLARQSISSSTASCAGLEEDECIDAMLAGAMALAPRDAQEGMIVAQMLGLHNAAMDSLRRAALDGQTFEGREMNLTQAAKLSRAYAALMDTLGRHRGGGTQKIIVERVTVNAGGQAIVGNIEHRREGVQKKAKEQPHAKQIAHAHGATLSCLDAPLDPMPITRDDERSLPDAWRRSNRRTKG